MTDDTLSSFVPGTSLPGIAWPAVPAGDAAAVFAILDQLGQSQWWPPALLRRRQARQLAALVAHAARTVPFYRERLADMADPALLAEQGVTAAAWRRLPWLTRREIQEAGAALDSSVVPSEHGAVGTVNTSGSTGTPVAVRRTQMAAMFWQAITLRDHLWQRRDLGARLAVIRTDDRGDASSPDGLVLPDWGMPTRQFYPTGPAALLAVKSPLAVQAQWLQRQRPDYLLTLPTNLLFLARHCREHGIALRLRGISTISEVVTPELRAICREAFGCEIADLYSTREAGYVALQCPSTAHYHVQAETMLVEILDEAGNDCAPGQIGRVVVTPLHEYATPLIRYDLGDMAEPGPPCACGRLLPVIRRIYGRVRNMLRLPSGQLSYPGYSLFGLSAIPAVIQHQVVQTSLDRLEVRLAVRRPLTAAEEAEARAMLDKSIGKDFAYAIAYCDEIPRGPGGKFEDFRCEVVA